jgi:hypothetical protein
MIAIGTDEIDEARMKHLGEYLEISSSDVSAFLARASQSTLFQLYKHSRKPIESEMITAAASFFQRFYLRESVIVYKPRFVLVACLNLAAKTEEYHGITLSDLVNALPDATELKAQVPIYEMKILAALDYDLVVEQPWLVQLYWADLLQDDFNTHLRVYDVASEWMRLWQWTDAVIVFEFCQLATAAVFKACRQIHNGSATPDETSENLQARITEIFNQVIPGINVESLLERIEGVANRHGPFEILVKDPQIASTAGYQKLSSLSHS